MKQIFADIFGYEYYLDETSAITLTQDFVSVGASLCKRTIAFQPVSTYDPNVDILLLRQMRPRLASLALAVELGYPCLIVGEKSTGKASLVKALAELHGAD